MQQQNTAPNAVCAICGKGFYARPCHVRQGWGRYCSIGCKYADPALKTFGEDHPRWTTSPAVATGHGRAQRLYQLGAPCERCEAKPATERHHVNGDTSNNTRENIQLLCHRCHMETDGRINRLRAAQRRKLTAESVATIKERYDAIPTGPGGRRAAGSVDALAAEFGISKCQIRKVARGESWANPEIFEVA